jgi:hypothetical protein
MRVIEVVNIRQDLDPYLSLKELAGTRPSFSAAAGSAYQAEKADLLQSAPATQRCCGEGDVTLLTVDELAKVFQASHNTIHRLETTGYIQTYLRRRMSVN